MPSYVPSYVRDENGRDSRANTPETFVPFHEEASSMEESLSEDRGTRGINEEYKVFQVHRIGMEHLVPEEPPSSMFGPEFDFSDVFKYNNPWPEIPESRSQQHRRPPTLPEIVFQGRYSSEEGEEVHPRRDARNAQANSRTHLIPKNQRHVSEPETESSPATVMGKYYGTIESRLSYRIMLGGRRHFGYYRKDRYWPFPIKKALRAMEDRLINSLDVQPDAKIFLDAGCGEGYVAMHLARRGEMRVHCIDIVDRHVSKAERNIMKKKIEESVTVGKMDYHNLDRMGEETFDGIYMMETLRHATDLEALLTQFLRVLRLNGKLVIYEFVRSDTMPCPEGFEVSAEMFTSLNHVIMFPANTLKEMLEEQGFRDVVVEDISAHIMPLLRLFFTIAYIPSFFIRRCGLQRFFVNQTSAIILYRGIKMGYWKYVEIKGKKSDEIVVHHSQPIPIPKKKRRNGYDWPFDESGPRVENDLTRGRLLRTFARMYRDVSPMP